MLPDSAPASPFKPLPGKPLTQFKLMLMLGYQPGLLRKHVLVFGFIVDWWHKDYKDALASVRHIVKHLKQRDPLGRGLYTGDVHSAIQDLVSWGWLVQEKGAGRRASRYIPVWEKSYSVLEIPNASETEISVLESPNAGVLESPNANGDSVPNSPNEDSLTGPGLRTGGQVCENNEFKAAPTAPSPVGLKATVTETALGGFAEFWRAYPRKHGKTKAAAAYAKLDPSPEDHAHIMVAVRDWAEHYRQHGTEKKWIPEPANWLANERWDEDLPIIHDTAKGASIAKAKANALPKPANDNDDDDDDYVGEHDDDEPFGMYFDLGEFTPEAGTYTAMFTGVNVHGDKNEHWDLDVEIKNSKHHMTTTQSFSTFHPHGGKQQRGRDFVDAIQRATKVKFNEDSDAEDILFIEVQAVIDERLGVTYSPLPANAKIRLLEPAEPPPRAKWLKAMPGS